MSNSIETTPKRISIPKRISMSRRKNYIKFMSSLPRLCSPTICGTMNFLTRSQRKKLQPQQQQNEEEVFEWSIDQIALLDPADFSNELDEIPLFNEIDKHDLDELYKKENEEFFDQQIIVPSPNKQIQQEEEVETEEELEMSISSMKKSSDVPFNSDIPFSSDLSFNLLTTIPLGTPSRMTVDQSPADISMSFDMSIQTPLNNNKPKRRFFEYHSTPTQFKQTDNDIGTRELETSLLSPIYPSQN